MDIARRVEQVRQQGGVPRVHPNGFVQLDLAIGPYQHNVGDVRLHVWTGDDALPRMDCEGIHDHTFDLRSTVLCGTLKHLVYDFDRSPEGAMDIWMARYIAPTVATLERTGVLGDARLRENIAIPGGQTYTFPAFEFHSTDTVGFTATLMEKTKVYPGYSPRVLYPCGGVPPAFSRHTVDEDILWAYINRALAERR